MKNFIWLIVAVAIVIYLYSGGDSDFVIPQQTTAERSENGIKTVEFMTLFDEKKPFSKLAHDDYYTIIEVYLDSCTICKRLEQGYNLFLKNRKDVLIRKVHFSESGVSFSFSGSEEEMQKQAEETQQLIESYKVCGTPHVEIYGPDHRPIATDDCAKKQGTQFLRQWISAETGIPFRTL